MTSTGTLQGCCLPPPPLFSIYTNMITSDLNNMSNFNMLFKSFIVSQITYCLPILFTLIYASDEKRIHTFFDDAIKLVIDDPDIDALMTT